MTTASDAATTTIDHDGTPPRWRRILGSTALEAIVVGTLLMLFEWRGIPDLPVNNIDPSWQAGLHMAAHGDLAWGRDLFFTYGPLGWLRQPTYWFEDSGRMAIAYLVLTRIAWLSVLWLLARRIFGRPIAAVVLLPTVWVLDDPVQLLGTAGALWYAGHQSHLSARGRTALVAALGAAAGWELLGKVNVGVLIGAATVVAVLATARGRELVRLAGAFAGAFLIVLLLGWIGTGQSLGDLAAYGRGALQIVSGYSEAMGYEDSTLQWQYPVMAQIVVLGLVAAWWCADGAKRTRIAVGAVWIVVAFFVFKAGFVRHDYFHATIPFATLAPLVLAMPWRVTWPTRALAIVLVLLPVVVVLKTTPAGDGGMAHLLGNAKLGIQQASGIVDGGRARTIRDQGKRNVQAADAMSPTTVEGLRGHSVAVWPWEVAAAWAYDLDWRPLPVFQAYQAYSTPLDRINRDRIASADAPDRILLNGVASIDGRSIAFDGPATTRQLLCRYRPLQPQDGQWVVLSLVHPPCSAPRRLSTQRADWGEQLTVPKPPRDGIVSMIVHGAAPEGAEKLRTTLYRSLDRFVDTGSPAGPTRVPPSVFDAGLPLRIGAATDLPGPYPFNPNASTVKLLRSDGYVSTDRPLTVEFILERSPGAQEEMRIARGARAASKERAARPGR
ncbi:MAG: hypothetical protein PGN13_04940 [Patulibacter minatonensis]